MLDVGAWWFGTLTLSKLMFYLMQQGVTYPGFIVLLTKSHEEWKVDLWKILKNYVDRFEK
jgi:hypothetical protein